VGGRQPICPNVSVEASTNQNFEVAVKDESFRADLFIG
jgi:transcriptional regulator with PAS, ATPase and Fis domain